MMPRTPEETIGLLCRFVEQRPAFFTSWELLVGRQLVDGVHLVRRAARLIGRREEV